MNIHGLAIAIATLSSSIASGQSLMPVIEAAMGRTTDQQMDQTDAVASIDQVLSSIENPLQTALGLSSRVTHSQRKSEDSNLVQVWKQRREITRSSIGVILNQSLRAKTSWGLALHRRSSEIDQGWSYAANASHWWLGETFRTGYSVRRNDDHVASVEYIDVDASRVITPEDVSGLVHAIDGLWILTPTTVTDLTMGLIQRNDRPDAQFANLGLRQHIRALSGSIHGRLSYFKNVGQIQPVTPIGEVIGRSAEAEWHQRMFGSFVGMVGYRSNLERHWPRSEDLPSKVVGSDYVQMRLMYRHWQEVWTDPSNEIYGFVHWYQNSNGLDAQGFGIGTRLLHF
jgi:hypothetical protein